MKRNVAVVAWYRFRATFARRWPGYATIVVLVGLLGGLAIGSVAAARRTQAAFPAYLASTDPSDLSGVTSFVNPTPGAAGLGYNAPLLARIAHLDHVRQVAADSGLNAIPLSRAGVPMSPAAFPATAGEVIGVDNASALQLDRPTAVQGRLFDPESTNEFIASKGAARVFGFHVGELVQFGVYTNAQTALRTFGTAAMVPYERIKARLVGLVTQNSSVVQDDTDAASNAVILVFPPALTVPLLDKCGYYTAAEVKVDDPGRYDTVVQREISAVLPPGFGTFQAGQASDIEAKAERSIKPESIAFGVFGGIAAIATVLVGAQLIGRRRRLDRPDLEILRAFGASPLTNMVADLIGDVAAVLVGAVVALFVAICLSPLAPLGPTRSVYPTPGVSFDWTVLLSGFAFIAIGLGALALGLSYRNAPHRVSSREARQLGSRSTTGRFAMSLGLPAPAVIGVGFAVNPGGGREVVPVRSAIVGVAMAVVALVATVTFGASLNALVSHPALYGWNWDYEMSANGGGVLPGAKIDRLLVADRSVAEFSPAYFLTAQFNSQIGVPILAEPPDAVVAPPLLSGHAIDAANQVVLGPLTLGALHMNIGDTVTVTKGNLSTLHLKIVGTATLPTIGGGEGNQHLEMGSGAWLSSTLLPKQASEGYDEPGAAPGPDALFVRLRGGAGGPGLTSLRRIAAATSTPADGGVSVLAVQRPAEIVNFRAMGSTPAILGSALALGAIAALALTLLASVRRRGRDLALLKTLGFTRRQVAATVAWQSSICIGIGTLIGMPIGIVLGRALWDVFARSINAVSVPNVPPLTMVLVALGALVIANLIAAIPARYATRTPIAVLLRSE